MIDMVFPFKKLVPSERCKVYKEMSSMKFNKMIKGMSAQEILSDQCLQMLTNSRFPDKTIVRRAPFVRGEGMPEPLRLIKEAVDNLKKMRKK